MQFDRCNHVTFRKADNPSAGEEFNFALGEFLK